MKKDKIKHQISTDSKPLVIVSTSEELEKLDKYEGYHECPNCRMRHGQINDHINHMELCNMISFY